MPAPFSRTTRALAQATATAAVLTWVGAALLLALWSAWFFGAEVALHEVSPQARLEVQQASHPLSAQLPGRVLATRLQIGQAVTAGEVLVELDPGNATLQLAEERARLTSLAEQATALRHEITTRQQSAVPESLATQAALDAAQARSREAAASLAWATDNERRLREESAAGSVAAVEALQARSEMTRLAATRDALAAEARRLQAAAAARAGEQRAQVDALQRTLAALEGEQAAAAQAAERLQLDIERHRVRAPVAGRVGDMAPLRVGDVVGAGQKFASVIPSGELMAVADFEPRAVLGRVRPGQAAQLRLDGFPWAQFGTLPATVSRVAGEVREGRIRVEFALQREGLQRSAAAGIALQHGLPAAVEVTVDRQSPAVLVLRASGQLLAGAAPSPWRPLDERRGPACPPLAGPRGRADLGHGLRPRGAEMSAGRPRHRHQLRAPARGLPDQPGRHLDRHAGRGVDTAGPARRADHDPGRPSGAAQAAALPAIVVVHQADGATHFVVVWRRLGRWLQVMDPATGRRWVRSDRFSQEALRHRMSLPAADWREWAASADNLAPLRERLQQLGADGGTAQGLLDDALAHPGWFGLGALDASARLVHTVVQAGGLARGSDALQLLRALFDNTRAADEDIFRHVPEAYWSAVPDVQAQARATEEELALGQQHLMVSGAVLMRVRGRVQGRVQGSPGHVMQSQPQDGDEARPALSAELRAALREKQPHPLATIWQLLRQDGLLGPVAMAGAMALAAGAVVAETLLFRGLLDIAGPLGLPSQRLLALGALLVFAALLLALEVPIVTESLRYGRHLEARLRMALLAKLPKLNDRYFQSRAVSDMAERSHSIQLARNVPMLGLNFVQSLAEMLLTLGGVVLIAPGALPWALGIVAAAVAVPLALQPLLNERDLRLRNHTAALGGFYLDALLGLVPVRTHRAERAVRRQHESLLVEWVLASRATLAATVGSGALQALLCQGLAVGLLVSHFLRDGGGAAIGGSDLLLVYWALKLPSLAGGVGSLARQYPLQRNVLLRLFEPLTAPEDSAGPDLGAQAVPAGSPGGVEIRIEQGRVLAGGHEILADVDLHIQAGEHIAIVGASGAGKSSLVGLFLGWHALQQGQLSVDGAVLDSASQQALRRQTAWVDPGVQLWNRSFLDNLGYASDDAALSRVGRVLQAARLTEVLARLPQGLQTPLGEGGALLSGGEGQRVRLGRAMLQDGVRLALLDEPFRGLDREQRRAMLADARQWWRHSTLLCVTHDVAETLGFRRVLVVDGGRIVEDGVPQILAAGDTHYARMLRDERSLHDDAWRSAAAPVRLDAAANDATLPGDTWRHLRVEDGRVVEDRVDIRKRPQ